MVTNVRMIESFVTQSIVDADGVAHKPRRRRRLTRPLSDWRPEAAEHWGAPPP
jgi:hypothetical protein